MDKLLVINAHPKIDSTSSVSLQVLHHFVQVYKKQKPAVIIDQIKLYEDEVPAVDKIVLNAWEKLGRGEQISNDEAKVTNRMLEVLKQFKSATKYVIAMPLYNFNIPSKLKDYMDNIIIADETFKYTENGSIGLLNDGRSLLVIQSSGGIYTNNDWYTEVEFSHKYLQSMFQFLGLADYQIIRAQGTSLFEQNQILRKAYIEAEEAASRLASVRRIQ